MSSCQAMCFCSALPPTAVPAPAPAPMEFLYLPIGQYYYFLIMYATSCYCVSHHSMMHVFTYIIFYTILCDLYYHHHHHALFIIIVIIIVLLFIRCCLCLSEGALLYASMLAVSGCALHATAVPVCTIID